MVFRHLYGLPELNGPEHWSEPRFRLQQRICGLVNHGVDSLRYSFGRSPGGQFSLRDGKVTPRYVPDIAGNAPIEGDGEVSVHRLGEDFEASSVYSC